MSCQELLSEPLRVYKSAWYPRDSWRCWFPKRPGVILMLQDNIFLKIIERKIPAAIVYEDDRCLAFRDVNPQAPVHVLIIPRKVIATHADIAEEDRDLLSHLHLVAA